MDETALQTESDNRRSWSPIGVSPILESNGSHKGLNLIRATELTKNFDTIIDELFGEVVDLYNHLNEQPFMIKSIVFYKNYYLDAIEDIG